MSSKRPMSSLREIKSIHSAGIRSIPKTQRSGYLDLYTLGREKDRLEKESSALDKRRTAAARQLEAVIGRIIKFQQETGLTRRTAREEQRAAAPRADANDARGTAREEQRAAAPRATEGSAPGARGSAERAERARPDANDARGTRPIKTMGIQY